MDKTYNEIHVIEDKHDDYVEISPEYVYLTIPAELVCIYHKLLKYMADFGKSMIDNCNAACKGNGKNIISCWNLFQSAIACHTLERYKERDFFIDYIKKQLDIIYKGTGQVVRENTVPLSITEDGKLKAMASCNNGIHFYVDTETGKLYQEYKDSVNDGKVYAVIDDELTVNDKDEDL